MVGYHVLLVLLFPAYIKVISWESLIFLGLLIMISCLSISTGYHRLFSHKTYTAHPLWEWLWLLISPLALQSSALRWAHDHRIHHTHVDTDKDPYSIKKGFWYAHVWWIFVYKDPINPRLVSDLMKNKRVMFQHRHYDKMVLFVNAAVFGIGCLFMSPLAAFVGGILLRIFIVHHCTWFINSLAHTWGSKMYAKELSAVDNAILAFLTFGEGYHNYHHAMPNDYRNGIRWYHFDPTKWLIWMASKIGLAKNLKWFNASRLQRVLIAKDKKLVLKYLKQQFDDTASELRKRFEELSRAYDYTDTLLMEKLAELKKATQEQRELLLVEIRQLKRELAVLWKSWGSLTKFAMRHYRIAA